MEFFPVVFGWPKGARDGWGMIELAWEVAGGEVGQERRADGRGMMGEMEEKAVRMGGCAR